jgi:hypothetical protein
VVISWLFQGAWQLSFFTNLDLDPEQERITSYESQMKRDRHIVENQGLVAGLQVLDYLIQQSILMSVRYFSATQVDRDNFFSHSRFGPVR